MTGIRFIHCSDLHIDSPLKRISAIDSATGALLQEATYQSFNNIINLAITERVDCVLISGDIYDSANKSLRAQLRFRDGLVRLSNEGIPAHVVHGNHDPLNSWSSKLNWPSNVFIFPGDRVECFPLIKNKEVVAQICGISFAKRDIYDNLALRFPSNREHVPRIGLLHTNAGANTGHEPYAPCTIADLSATGVDYWALGHVHLHSILKSSSPAIVYPGCTQSTHPGETGEKGCCLVELEPSGEANIRFVPTDSVRFKSDSLDISTCSSIDDVISGIIRRGEEILAAMSNRHVVLRLSLVGRSELHSELIRGNTVDELEERVRGHFEGRVPYLWLERLALNTAGTYDLQVLRKGDDFIADIISISDRLEDPQGEYWQAIQDRLSILFSSWQGQKYLNKISQSDLMALAEGARNSILDRLIGAE